MQITYSISILSTAKLKFMFKHKVVLAEFVNSSSINRGELDMMLTILIAVNQKYDTVVHVYINTKSSCWTKILNAEYFLTNVYNK